MKQILLIATVFCIFAVFTNCKDADNPPPPLQKSEDAALSQLSISDGENELLQGFDSQHFVYAVTVPYSIKKVVLSGESSNEKATISYQREDADFELLKDGIISLDEGENNLAVKVTAENGNHKIYTVKITVGDTLSISGTAAATTNSTYDQVAVYVSAYSDSTGESLIGNTSANIVTGQWNMQIPAVYRIVYFRIIVKESTEYQFGKMAGSEEIPVTGKENISLSIEFRPPEIKSFMIKKEETGLENDLIADFDENDTVVFSVPGWIENITELKAEFEAEGIVTVNGIMQESGVTKNNFRQSVIYTVTAEDHAVRNYTVSFASSPQTDDFPVININTDGRAVDSTEDWLEDASFSLYDKDGIVVVTEITSIKGRGHSTWAWFSKKPYSIKLSKKAELFNMPSHKRWNLLANASDVTLLRNQIGFKLGYIFDNMAWTPHSQQVHLYLNSEYIGVYQLTEAIKIDKNRVNISEISKKNPDRGYILSIDNKKTEVFNFTTTQGLVFNCEDPDEDLDSIITGDTISLFDKIKTDVQHLEDVLYGDSFADENEGYRKYIDVDSFVDWYLASEIVSYHENLWSSHGASIYMYYDSGKYFAGPLWDFDFGFSNYYAPASTSGFKINTEGWIKRLFEDPYFVSQVKKRWNEKKPDIGNVLPDIDVQASSLEKAQSFNFIRWNVVPWDPISLVTKEYRQQKIEELKTWIAGRINWLDSALRL
jgi:hypothetical protein